MEKLNSDDIYDKLIGDDDVMNILDKNWPSVAAAFPATRSKLDSYSNKTASTGVFLLTDLRNATVDGREVLKNLEKNNKFTPFLKKLFGDRIGNTDSPKSSPSPSPTATRSTPAFMEKVNESDWTDLCFKLNDKLVGSIEVLSYKLQGTTVPLYKWADFKGGVAVVKTLNYVRNSQGKKGLSAFKEALRSMGETASIDDIDSSSCSFLFEL